MGLSLRIGGMSIMLAIALSGCAVLHHVQVGQVDSRNPNVAWIPFEILVSETGVNVEEIGKMSRATQTRAGDQAGDVAGLIALFQIGPRTGNPVYNEHYAEKIIYALHEKCPSGQITGVTSVREMRKYPAISGEIVKVTGYCLRQRKGSRT